MTQEDKPLESVNRAALAVAHAYEARDAAIKAAAAAGYSSADIALFALLSKARVGQIIRGVEPGARRVSEAARQYRRVRKLMDEMAEET